MSRGAGCPVAIRVVRASGWRNGIARRVAALLLPLFSPALALAAPLTAELLTGDLHLRKAAPIPLEVRITNHTQSIIEGRIELTLLRGGTAAAIHRSGELVIQPGARVVPLSLPSLPEAEDGDGLGAQIRFTGKSGELDLGRQQIGIFGLGANQFILAIPRAGRRLAEMDTARERGIYLESLRPALDKAPWLAITTIVAPLTAEQIPRHPLGWCAYDAVMLDGPAFAAAGEKQLTSLARWVEGGGSVFVCTNDPPAAGLGAHHVAFLQRLAASQPAVSFSIGENGRVTWASRDAGPRMFRTGIGRAVIATATPASRDEYKHKSWREAVAWLWKVRADHRGTIAREGTLDNDWAKEGQAYRGFDDPRRNDWEWDAANGFSALTPGAPRQLPLAVVAGVLGLLLVLIGPGDWMVLGWLRRRRWTWFVFPVLSAGFAWWMAHLSGKYLGVADRTGMIRLVDVGGDGRVLREVRYEMLFPANDREWTHDLRDAIAVPVPRPGERFITFPPVEGTVGFRIRTPDAPAVSEWSSPGHFTLRRSVRQWTPALVRVTSFPDAKDDSGIDWNAAEESVKTAGAATLVPDAEDDSENDLKAEDEVSVKLGSRAGLHAADFVQGEWSGIDTGKLESSPRYFPVSPNGPGISPHVGETLPMREQFARQAQGFLNGLLVGRSPQAAGGLGDADTDQRTLVAWRRVGNAIHIFRRYFREVAQ